MFNCLSFAVCLTTSKAIAQSWGSYINHHFKTKPNTKGLELENTAAVDKLTFVRLNGPPPGLSLNRKICKSALALMFKGDYATYFWHIGRNLKPSSDCSG